jgi:hypothetical protein
MGSTLFMEINVSTALHQFGLVAFVSIDGLSHSTSLVHGLDICVWPEDGSVNKSRNTSPV